ncbi:AAA family ATPase [Verrucosispora sp. WMMD573]|uniref:AAA family ATPase n=1 Tax=Verrucosispora sp. WMMD573 TaxID=3015149 RepID=UPI00248ADC3B|nr:AAA family ATPase [Verrucosispora sp. WMMD573]WBB56290.1 AAA family ATPase [Verrucosispora sp. WMMD573]
MATADQVKALVRSHGEGDDARFYSVALQVAAKAARSGQAHFAQELRDLVDGLRATSERADRPVSRPVPVARPRGELADLLSVAYPTTRLADLALEPEVRQRLERVLLEQRQQDRLREHGFDPLRRLLLVGPPGTGKTMTARSLAGELRLPLFTIRLDALITKMMGETAAKLRLVFDALAETRGIYLFDEVDALGGERSRTNDVGEIRRVLNSFLQFLDQQDSDSLLVAASNHPQLLDRALFRRFDLVVGYPLPTPEVSRAVIRNRLATMGPKKWAWSAIDEAAAGLSHAEITVACELAAKEAILSGQQHVTPATLAAALRDRQNMAHEKQ